MKRGAISSYFPFPTDGRVFISLIKQYVWRNRGHHCPTRLLLADGAPPDRTVLLV